MIRPRDTSVNGPLRFGRGNAKLDPSIWTFSIPAGHFCPFASSCKSQADRQTGYITDGAQTEFRCYAASSETIRRKVREWRWRNAELLLQCRSLDETVDLILRSLSPYAGVVRWMESGDFFSQRVFDAVLEVARQRPQTRQYFYTKSLQFWIRRITQVGDGYQAGEVENLVPTASWGGSQDHLIIRHRLRSARVVLSVEEAENRQLELDHDDSHAMFHGPDFALLIHGSQPAGTQAAKAVSSLRKEGWFGYGRRANTIRATRRLGLPTV
jgi:hypothetical protein